MSELTKLLVLAIAFAAFILAAYLQEGGSWRGPHNLRKSLPAKETKITLQNYGDSALNRPWPALAGII